MGHLTIVTCVHVHVQDSGTLLKITNKTKTETSMKSISTCKGNLEPLISHIILWLGICCIGNGIPTISNINAR